MYANKPRYRLIAISGALLLAAAIVYVALQQRWTGVLVMAAFLAISLVVIVRRSQLPTLFEALFVLAALLNAAGYVWNLYTGVGWYDEVAHLYTGFAVTLALGFLLYGELMQGFRRHRIMFVVTLTCMGVAIGTFWEIAEWLFELGTGHDMIGDIPDTMTDLVLDAIGAFVAALFNLSGLNER